MEDQKSVRRTPSASRLLMMPLVLTGFAGLILYMAMTGTGEPQFAKPMLAELKLALKKMPLYVTPIAIAFFGALHLLAERLEITYEHLHTRIAKLIFGTAKWVAAAAFVAHISLYWVYGMQLAEKAQSGQADTRTVTITQVRN